MAIVTLEYYNNVYIGEPVATTDFPRYDATAERIIGAATGNRYTERLEYLTAKGYTAAATALTTAYSNAICAQIEYLISNDILSVTTGGSEESFTVGKVSVSSGGTGASFATRGAAMLSPAAQMYLEETGLLGRHLAVPVEPFAPFPVV